MKLCNKKCIASTGGDIVIVCGFDKIDPAPGCEFMHDPRYWVLCDMTWVHKL